MNLVARNTKRLAHGKNASFQVKPDFELVRVLVTHRDHGADHTGGRPVARPELEGLTLVGVTIKFQWRTGDYFQVFLVHQPHNDVTTVHPLTWPLEAFNHHA